MKIPDLTIPRSAQTRQPKRVLKSPKLNNSQVLDLVGLLVLGPEELPTLSEFLLFCAISLFLASLRFSPIYHRASQLLKKQLAQIARHFWGYFPPLLPQSVPSLPILRNYLDWPKVLFCLGIHQTQFLNGPLEVYCCIPPFQLLLTCCVYYP